MILVKKDESIEETTFDGDVLLHEVVIFDSETSDGSVQSVVLRWLLATVAPSGCRASGRLGNPDLTFGRPVLAEVLPEVEHFDAFAWAVGSAVAGVA